MDNHPQTQRFCLSSLLYSKDFVLHLYFALTYGSCSIAAGDRRGAEGSNALRALRPRDQEANPKDERLDISVSIFKSFNLIDSRSFWFECLI